MDRCLMQVHAHPDDEASKGAGVAALYAARGVRTVLVTCTGGEAGEILNPAADTSEARADLGAVRRRELDESAAILGYARVHLLGYRDSGMPDSEANRDPRNFWNAPVGEATERLVRIVRAERPQVIVAYGEDHSRYPHPDHIRAHEIAVAAFDAAGRPDAYPASGEPWQPIKLYWCGFTTRSIRAAHDAILAKGVESPFGDWLEGRTGDDEQFTARIDVGGVLEQRRDALLAHATQVAPDSFWFALSVDEVRTVWPWEEYVLARSLVAGPARGELETDLFAGLDAPAEQRS